MYHRVCERVTSTEPYFARGTAVEPAIFAAQLAWLCAHASPMDFPALWAQRDRPGMGVHLTFDDGYLDCMAEVLPRCTELGAPWSIFPIADAARSQFVPWVDRYYAVLTHADTDRRPLLGWLGGAAPYPIRRNLRHWVRGGPKAALFALAAQAREEALERLAYELGVALPLSTPSFCSVPQLRQLAEFGVGLGGHGVRHERLGDAAPQRVAAEIRGSRALLDEVSMGSPRLFCYPDGSHSEEARSSLREQGFEAAFTVEPGIATSRTDPWRIPRFIVRNLPPGAPGWCEAWEAQ